MPAITAGRLAITLGNLAYAIGAFIADWSETHVKNPRWPPHARFHNGQTMSLGALMASTSLYFLFKPATRIAGARENVFHAALIGSFYCVAAWTAILYPGTAWQDPEFRQGGEQRYLFSAILGLVWLGYGLEMRRLTKSKEV